MITNLFRLLAAVALTVGLVACGDDDDPTRGQADDPAADCNSDQPDCEDTGGSSMNMCAADAPDCNDMVDPEE